MIDITTTSEMGAELVQAWGSDELVAQAARTSTATVSEKYAGLVRALWTADPPHLGPFEHAGMTVALHVPLFVRDQLVRHKSFSFSVQSGRYTEFEPVFWVPADDRPLMQPEGARKLDYERVHGDSTQRFWTQKQLSREALGAWSTYLAMLKDEVVPEVASRVLPTTIYTRMWMSGSLRSWLHLLDVRVDKHAQHEVREAVSLAQEHIKAQFPVAYAAWEDRKGGFQR